MATLSAVDEAIQNQEIDISVWKNAPMKRIVQSVRDLINQNETLEMENAQLKDAIRARPTWDQKRKSRMRS